MRSDRNVCTRLLIKRAALVLWVQAVNEHGGFGTWAADVVVGIAAGMQDVAEQHS